MSLQRSIVLVISIIGLIGAASWSYYEPGFEPFLAVLTSLAFIIGSYWPAWRKSYSKSRTHGCVTFDYGSNDGTCNIGEGAFLFETKWSKASGDSIHIYNDPPSIQTVALASGASLISEVKDASKYDGSSRSRTPQEGDIVILKNRQGNYAALHVIDIKDRTRTDDRDEVTFSYVINDAKRTSFST